MLHLPRPPVQLRGGQVGCSACCLSHKGSCKACEAVGEGLGCSVSRKGGSAFEGWCVAVCACLRLPLTP